MKSNLTRVTIDSCGDQQELVIRRHDRIIIELEEGHPWGGKVRLYAKDGKLVVHGDRALTINPEVSNVIYVGLEVRP